MQVKLQGIPGIRKVFMRELKTTHLDQDGIYQTENQWVLDTEGVNLLDVSSACLANSVLLLSLHFSSSQPSDYLYSQIRTVLSKAQQGQYC